MKQQASGQHHVSNHCQGIRVDTCVADAVRLAGKLSLAYVQASSQEGGCRKAGQVGARSHAHAVLPPGTRRARPCNTRPDGLCVSRGACLPGSTTPSLQLRAFEAVEDSQR